MVVSVHLDDVKNDMKQPPANEKEKEKDKATEKDPFDTESDTNPTARELEIAAAETLEVARRHASGRTFDPDWPVTIDGVGIGEGRVTFPTDDVIQVRELRIGMWFVQMTVLTIVGSATQWSTDDHWGYAYWNSGTPLETPMVTSTDQVDQTTMPFLVIIVDLLFLLASTLRDCIHPFQARMNDAHVIMSGYNRDDFLLDAFHAAIGYPLLMRLSGDRDLGRHVLMGVAAVQWTCFRFGAVYLASKCHQWVGDTIEVNEKMRKLRERHAIMLWCAAFVALMTVYLVLIVRQFGILTSDDTAADTAKQLAAVAFGFLACFELTRLLFSALVIANTLGHVTRMHTFLMPFPAYCSDRILALIPIYVTICVYAYH